MLTTDGTRTETGRATKHRCNSLHCGPARRTAVYRLYDRNQRLLYVGIAHDTKKRWREHARNKDWWNQVRWRTAVWHSSRLGAAIEEYCAFRYENPIHNKARDYDRRLGWEPGTSPGNHEPRPWRLDVLASAMTYPDGGIAWKDAAPHHVVVKCANQDGAGEGRIRVWFPLVPELGYWYCVAATDAELHVAAMRILTQRHGLESGSFTLSVHEPDGCLEPNLEQWVPAERAGGVVEVLPDRPWWKKVDVLWKSPKPVLLFLEWWYTATMGLFAATVFTVYAKEAHPYNPGTVELGGLVGGLLVHGLRRWSDWRFEKSQRRQ